VFVWADGSPTYPTGALSDIPSGTTLGFGAEPVLSWWRSRLGCAWLFF